MKPHIKLDITVGVVQNMTVEQFESLKKNVLAEGQWESVDEPVRISGHGYLGVHLPNIFLGIEKDGYCHS